MTQKEMSDQFKVKITVIKSIAKDNKKGSPMFDKKEAKHQIKLKQVEIVKQAVESILADYKDIINIDQVLEEIGDKCEKPIAKKLISQVLHQVFNMRFRKVKPTSFLGNTQRSLVLRCLYAQKFLEALDSGDTIINIDETWINQADFRRYRWSAKGQSASLPIKGISPRISMITAVSTKGDVYLSLT